MQHVIHDRDLVPDEVRDPDEPHDPEDDGSPKASRGAGRSITSVVRESRPTLSNGM
jgi:hypothetical protein